MKITSVESADLEIPYEAPLRPAWQPGVTRLSRDFTFVAVRTESGITGYSGTDGHFSKAIQRSVTPYLVGQDLFATERHALMLRNVPRAWFIDVALWDAIGKAVDVPLMKLWGYSQGSVRAYASSAELGKIDNRVELAKHYQQCGFTALKLRFHRPSLQEDLEILDAVIGAVPGMTVMVDANQATSLPSPERSSTWDLRRALGTARALEERGVLWLEEPLPRYSKGALRRLRESTDIYIAGGEKNLGLHEFASIIDEGLYDVVQPDPTMSEGVSQLRKVAGMAEMFDRQFAPHHGVSGFGLAAGIHLACTVAGPTWVEFMYEPPSRTVETYQQLRGVIRTKIWIDEYGDVRAPEGPGLGLEVNEGAIERLCV